MRRRDDDLSPFRDDPVLQALTGPATADELAGEAEALAAFRAATASRPRRRVAARIGTGGAVAVAGVVLSGGVAAAYTASFPAPVQRVLHAALAPIDVPPPQPDHPKTVKVEPTHLSTPPASASPVPTVSSLPSPETSSGTPSAKPTASASPTTTTTPVVAVPPVTSPSPTATPTPTASRPPLPGATFAITVSSSRVSAGDSVTVSGSLQDETGTPVVDRRVVLAEHLTGQPGWTKVDVAVTDATGAVTFVVAGLDHNARFVLRGGGRVHSNVAKVAVAPIVTAAVAAPIDGAIETTVTVTATGGVAGDEVVLKHYGRHHWTRSGVLDSTGEVVFTISVPMHHVARYRVVVLHTRAHAGSGESFTVAPPEAATS